jgi:purine-nucleoside phosphorylase
MIAERPRIEEAVASIRRRTGAVRHLGIVLGSGLGPLVDEVAVDAALPYAEIPHFPVSTAAGHEGRLVLGRLEQTAVAVMQGRAHLYEGYTAAQVAFPIRVMAALGVRTLIVTNAAGGITRRLKPGDLMVITDHINYMGTNPLIGPNDDALGPRFPDLSRAYDPDLVALAIRAGRDEGISLRTGVYLAVSGPSYETPAELAMMARWGAAAVGMSTVPEVIVAGHAGIRVLGISAITNVAHGAEPPSHDAVLRAAREMEPRFVRVVRRVVRRLAARAV